uniref:Reverse transcriptase n=1 Tax=Neogobius melanostomus TaxID=47308 RepID=A0A8C6TC84_9GOBI
MNILPRLIFLFSSIPMQFPQKWFRAINKEFTTFLWKEKRSRISLRKLSIPRKSGGLGVPDMYTYYLALNAQYPLTWAYKKDPCEIGSWSWLEQKVVLDTCKNISIASFWYKPKCDKRIQNPIIKFSCEIAQAIHKRLKINGLSLPSCPIWNNLLFTAGGQPLANDSWKNKNIRTLGQILHGAEIMPFQQLKTIFNLSDTHFFQYMQFKAILSNLSKEHPDIFNLVWSALKQTNI